VKRERLWLNMYAVMPVIGRPTAAPKKSAHQSICGRKMPTSGMEARSALSVHKAASVMKSATSQ
jgi:hypothetical protein